MLCYYHCVIHVIIVLLLPMATSGLLYPCSRDLCIIPLRSSQFYICALCTEFVCYTTSLPTQMTQLCRLRINGVLIGTVSSQSYDEGSISMNVQQTYNYRSLDQQVYLRICCSELLGSGYSCWLCCWEGADMWETYQHLSNILRHLTTLFKPKHLLQSFNNDSFGLDDLIQFQCYESGPGVAVNSSSSPIVIYQ